MGLGWGLSGLKMQGNSVLPLFMVCDTPESLNPSLSILSLTHSSAITVFNSGLYYVFTAASPPRPTNGLDSRRRMELGRGETPQGAVHRRPYTGGGDTF